MKALPHVAILSLDGELKDVSGSFGEHSCLVYSDDPITQDRLEALQLDLGAAFTDFTPAESAEVGRKCENPLPTVEEVLAKHKMEIVDVANIWIPRPGQVWIQGSGYDFHTNKLRRLRIKR
jgi:hypothetical protein